MPKHPMQPIVMDGQVARFKDNKIVRYLQTICREKGICNLNDLAYMHFSREDWNQFAQLIGYSVGGFGELSYAFPSVVKEADAIVAEMIAKRKRKN